MREREMHLAEGITGAGEKERGSTVTINKAAWFISNLGKATDRLS